MDRYRHYKGGIYELLSISVLHTETNERLAVYQNTEGNVFARPYDMFLQNIMVDGKEVPRFKKIKSRELIPSVNPFPPTASQMGKIGGAAKTEAKASSSRENGKKGGRPRKEKGETK